MKSVNELAIHYRRSAPKFSTRNEAPSSRTLPTCARACTLKCREKIKHDPQGLKLIRQRETRSDLLLLLLFLFIRSVFLFTSKKREIRPDMIARLGSSRPEKSRGRHFKSPSFIVLLFFVFFLSFFIRFSFYVVVVVVVVLLCLLRKKIIEGALFRHWHTHTHDRPRVGGTGRSAFGGQYDL